jgi:hypothetical protein
VCRVMVASHIERLMDDTTFSRPPTASACSWSGALLCPGDLGYRWEVKNGLEVRRRQGGQNQLCRADAILRSDANSSHACCMSCDDAIRRVLEDDTFPGMETQAGSGGKE